MLGRGYSKIETPGIDASGVQGTMDFSASPSEPPPEIKEKVHK
jgi:hypothetical protein